MARLFAATFTSIALATTLAQPARALPKSWPRSTNNLLESGQRELSVVKWLGETLRFPGERVLNSKKISSTALFVVTDRAFHWFYRHNNGYDHDRKDHGERGCIGASIETANDVVTGVVIRTDKGNVIFEK